MGSASEPNTNAIDATVGGLVWVRRRNGSWWPGRIMGVDELSETCLVSPRSGTPVKLLGREDASVDWYNLEKSKRVKAFRCGEYDECIEKAKASAANSSKKAVKYARREDAILHALELESARQSKDHPEFSLKMNDLGGENFYRDAPATSHSREDTRHMDHESSSSEDDTDSAQEFSRSSVSFEEPNQFSEPIEQLLQGTRRRTPNDSEDDGTEGVKRMRGLEDLGMGAVSSLKRKRSQVAHVHEFLKRKNRRRTLTKVLESTAMVSVPVMCEQLPSPNRSPLLGVSDSKVSGLESNEWRKNSLVVLNNSDSTGGSCGNGTSLYASAHASDASLVKCKQKENENFGIAPENDSLDKLFDVPFVGEENNPSGFAPIPVTYSSQNPLIGAGGQSSQSSQVENVSLGDEEHHESGSTSSGAADIDSISQRTENGSSKWQLKRKRNLRHTGKSRRQSSRKCLDIDDESYDNLDGLESRDDSMDFDRTVDHNHGGVTEFQVDEYQGWSGYIPHKVPHTAVRSLPYRQSRFTVNPKYQAADFPVRNYNYDSYLYDVNLEVKTSYRPQHVPYISLMSKLNGQPIIGHPLTVEVLDDGFYDLFVNGPECHMTSRRGEVYNNLKDNISGFEALDNDHEVKPNSGSAKHLKFYHMSPSKSPKSRRNGLLSKKVRKLSSLTGSHRRGGDRSKLMLDKIKDPAVACVPLKVVFSRINVSLNSSVRPVRRVLPPFDP